jgi:hypothetical protein
MHRSQHEALPPMETSQLNVPVLALLAFVIFHGMAFGAGLFEQRITVPYLDSHAMRTDDTGRQFWGFISTGPLSVLLLINLYYAAISVSPARSLWLAACATTLVERIFTFSFFIPRAIRLMREAEPVSAEAAASAIRWRSLNWLRLALSLLAWLLALAAYGNYRTA